MVKNTGKFPPGLTVDPAFALRRGVFARGRLDPGAERREPECALDLGCNRP